MAKTLSSASITDGSAVEAWHVTQSVDALNGVEAYDLIISGSLTLTNDTTMAGTASYAVTASYAENAGGGGSSDTGSLLTTASISDATITFTKGDASTFNIIVNNVTTANTASYVLGSNVDGTVTTAGTLKANGNLAGLTTASGHIIPAANDTYDLGSAEYKFRDLYLGSNSIYMSGSGGWMTGSWDGTNFKVNNNALVRSAVTSSMAVSSATTSTQVVAVTQDVSNPSTPVPGEVKFAAGSDTLSAGSVVINTFNGELASKTLGRNCWITATYEGTPGDALRVALNTGDIIISEASGTSTSTVSFIVIYL